MTERGTLFLAWVGAIFLSSWLVMLTVPLATNGALLPGYWQVVWTEYILGSLAGVITLSVKSVLIED